MTVPDTLTSSRTRHHETDRKREAAPASRRTQSSRRAAARQLLLLCTASVISPREREQIDRLIASQPDWQYLLDLANWHGITPLLAHNLLAAGTAARIPGEYAARLNQCYHHNLFRNMILVGELNAVIFRLQQHGITVLVLKGTLLAEQVYGNPGLRTVGDIDILVPPEKLSLARSLLLEMGYQQNVSATWNHPFHEAPYLKKGPLPVFLELHWGLDDARLLTVPHAIIWQRARSVRSGNTTMLTLSPEDTILFLANHLSKHANNLLRSLNDVAGLLKAYNGSLDWSYILAMARSWGIEVHTYYCLKRAAEIIGAPVPETIIARLRPRAWRRWLISFLMSGDFFISGTRNARLQEETFILTRVLMLRHFSQAKLVLSRNHNDHGKTTRLKAVCWIPWVLAAALWRCLGRLLPRK